MEARKNGPAAVQEFVERLVEEADTVSWESWSPRKKATVLAEIVRDKHRKREC